MESSQIEQSSVVEKYPIFSIDKLEELGIQVLRELGKRKKIDFNQLIPDCPSFKSPKIYGKEAQSDFIISKLKSVPEPTFKEMVTFFSQLQNGEQGQKHALNKNATIALCNYLYRHLNALTYLNLCSKNLARGIKCMKVIFYSFKSCFENHQLTDLQLVFCLEILSVMSENLLNSLRFMESTRKKTVMAFVNEHVLSLCKAMENSTQVILCKNQTLEHSGYIDIEGNSSDSEEPIDFMPPLGK